MNKVFAAMTSFNRQPMVKKSIESLLNSTPHMAIDFLLWDNNSGEPMQKLMDKLEALKLKNGSTITVIRSPENVGLGEALYKLQNYRKPLQHFLKMDSDVHVPQNPYWLNELVDLVETYGHQYPVIGFPPFTNEYLNNNYTPRGVTYAYGTADIYPTDYVAGPCFLGHRDFFNVFRYSSHTKKYGAGCDMDLRAYTLPNKIDMAYLGAPNEIQMMDSDNALAGLIMPQCPEVYEYHQWKLDTLYDKSTADFVPTQLGEDSSELEIGE